MKVELKIGRDPLDYPGEPTEWEAVTYDEKILKRPFIADQLDGEIKYWHSGRAVIINAPTGAGKTWFVLKKLVKKAVFMKKNVLIVTNRNPLNISYKKAVADVVGCTDDYTTVGLKKATKFGDFVYVANYQGLGNFLKKNSHLQFEYVFCDEVHFFMQDSTFNCDTGHVLKMIPRKFSNSVRVYVSATIDEILPVITEGEMYQWEVGHFGELYPKGCFREFEMGFRWNNAPVPLLYRMDKDFSKIALCFYDNEKEVLDYLTMLNSQTVAFCHSIKKCKEIGGAFESSLEIDAEYLSKKPEILEELVEKEGFEEKVFATTSVFTNGNNLKKKSIKNVIITLWDEVEIFQMVGRRRIDQDDPSDGFILYLPIPELGQLQKEISRINKLLNEVKSLDQDEIELLYRIKDGGEFEEEIRNAFYVDSKMGKYCLNELFVKKYENLLRYYEFLRAVITEKGELEYCRILASKFGKEFDEKMIFKTLSDRRAELLEFVCNHEFLKNSGEFERFASEFLKKRVSLFGTSKSDNLSEKRNVPGMRAINNRLRELNIGVQILKVGENYMLQMDVGGDVEYEENKIEV